MTEEYHLKKIILHLDQARNHAEQLIRMLKEESVDAEEV